MRKCWVSRRYVAPEVVMGYGENEPTGQPYGKGCDLWSMGVLLCASARTQEHARSPACSHLTLLVS